MNGRFKHAPSGSLGYCKVDPSTFGAVRLLNSFYDYFKPKNPLRGRWCSGSTRRHRIRKTTEPVDAVIFIYACVDVCKMFEMLASTHPSLRASLGFCLILCLSRKPQVLAVTLCQDRMLGGVHLLC